MAAGLASGPPPPAPEPEPLRTVVSDRADDDPLDAQRRIDAATPGFATAIDVGDEVGARPADALAEVVARTPGATVRSIGGLGQFSSVSLRGSAPQQVAIFIDGVPVGGGFAGLVDLGRVPLDTLSRVEVYRGYVPIAFGGATIGGAINLVSARARKPRLTLAAGAGSYGARQGQAAVVAPLSRKRRAWIGTHFGYAGATGNFPYFDDGGTPQLTADDVTRTRVGNHYDRLLGQLRVDGRSGAWRYGVQQLVGYRAQAIPGTASSQAREVRLETLAARTIARARRSGIGGPGGHVTWLVGLGAERRDFDDPLGEAGIGVQDQRTVGVDLYLSPRMRTPLWRGAFLGITADERIEWIAVDERAPTAGTTGDARRNRFAHGLGVELEQFAWERRIRVVPAVRIDAIDSRFATSAGTGEQSDAGRDALEFGVSPRAGLRLQIIDALSLRGSAGRYFRPPTLLELFGDRGYAVGNEGLRSERGTTIDGGVVFDRAGRTTVYGQVAGFATWAEDLIQWINAGRVTRPQNVSGARLRGVEVGVSVVAPRRIVRADANYTFTDSENRQSDPNTRGQPLPGRPRHEAFARVSFGYPWTIAGAEVEPRILYTADAIAGTLLDPSGRFELPARVVQGIGLELHVIRRLHAAFEVRNLLDVRTARVRLPVAGGTTINTAVSDFLGFPLPGRSVWFTLRAEVGWPARRAST